MNSLQGYLPNFFTSVKCRGYFQQSEGKHYTHFSLLESFCALDIIFFMFTCLDKQISCSMHLELELIEKQLLFFFAKDWD